MGTSTQSNDCLIPSAGAAGALLFSPEHASAAVEAGRRHALVNPAHAQWMRHQKGPEPAKMIPIVRRRDSGPWSGGRWAPLYAPLVVGSIVERTTAPEAPAVLMAMGLQLRRHQQAALDAWIRAGSGVVLMPCGAGKTTFGLSAIASRSTPALVLVHTRDLAEQWIERINEQLSGVSVGRWYGGKKEDGRVVVATVQTLIRQSFWELHTWASRFGLLIMDEAHHVPASTFLSVVGAIPARYRLALTATPDRPDGLEALLYMSFGGVVYEASLQQLEENGLVLRPQVCMVRTGWRGPDGEPHERAAALAEDAGRNDQILDLARRAVVDGRRVLILCDRVAHCVGLAAMLVRTGIQARPMIGEMTPSQREAVLSGLRDGSISVVAATKLADEGLDVPELDTVILATPCRNAGIVQQRIGRALRPRPGKARPVVIDLVDSNGPALGAAAVRRGLYRRLGWLS